MQIQYPHQLLIHHSVTDSKLPKGTSRCKKQGAGPVSLTLSRLHHPHLHLLSRPVTNSKLPKATSRREEQDCSHLPSVLLASSYPSPTLLSKSAPSTSEMSTTCTTEGQSCVKSMKWNSDKRTRSFGTLHQGANLFSSQAGVVRKCVCFFSGLRCIDN